MLDGLDFSWHLNLISLLALALICLLYILGIRLAGRGGAHPPLNGWRIAAIISAIALGVLVLLTPLDTIARTQLFAAHMLQAVILTTLCAPLLLASCPDWLVRPILEQPVSRAIAQALTRPLVASMLFNLTFWPGMRLQFLMSRKGVMRSTRLKCSASCLWPCLTGGR